MKPTKTALDLHEFFPVALEIYDIVSDENQYLLFLFIDNCKEGDNMNLSRFADGLNQDIEAVLNAVVSNWSNGFVYGISPSPNI